MPDIIHQFPINAPVEKVFDAISTPDGLDSWWTLRCAADAKEGSEYQLYFGEEYDWRAIASVVDRPRRFELGVTAADDDWKDSRLIFELMADGPATTVKFRHMGWPVANEHFCISSFCWAMYLRLLKRFVEFGEVVSYEKRLDV
jgi:uncharacterized protein YndB with AHSA1/START domain